MALSRGTTRLIGVLLAVGVVGYVFTPLTGGFGFVFNLRYLAPVLLVGFALLPVVVPWRRLAVAASAVVIVADLRMPHRERIPAWPSGAVLPVLAAVAVAGACVYGCVRWRPAVVPVAIAVLCAFGVVQHHYLDHRYVAAGLDNDAIDAYFRDVRDADVVVFGTDETLPFFGLDLSNRVARGDVPPVAVGADPCRTWRAELSGRADYVILAEHHFGYFVVPPDEALAADPAAEVVLHTAAGTVYRITGPLHPEAC
jgi:hypothetical protein